MSHARRASSSLLRAPSSRAKPDADVISRSITPAPCRLPPAATVTASAPRRAVIECIMRLAELGWTKWRRSRERAPRKTRLANDPHRCGRAENGLPRAKIAYVNADQVDRARGRSVGALVAPQQPALPAGGPQATKCAPSDVALAQPRFMWSSRAPAACPGALHAWRLARRSL